MNRRKVIIAIRNTDTSDGDGSILVNVLNARNGIDWGIVDVGDGEVERGRSGCAGSIVNGEVEKIAGGLRTVVIVGEVARVDVRLGEGFINPQCRSAQTQRAVGRDGVNNVDQFRVGVVDISGVQICCGDDVAR